MKNDEIDYRNISLLVRPAKVAIFFPSNDINWKFSIHDLFAWVSKIWGGAYFLIIPTDGNTIDESFWKILEEYSPDYIYTYNASINLKNNNSSQKKTNREINNKNNYQKHPFILSEDLQEQLLQKLTPFYGKDAIVSGYINSSSSVPFPLTEIKEIAQQGKLKKVFVVDDIDDIDCSLEIFSNWGFYHNNDEFELTEIGVEIIHISSENNLHNLLFFSMKQNVDELDLHFRNITLQDNKTKLTLENITRDNPFEATLLKVGKYKSLKSEYQPEQITVIFGDTVEDFCLYYCLSRFHNNVYWLPKICLPNIREDGDQYNEALISSVLAQIVYGQIHFDGRYKGIHISSLSFSNNEMDEVKNIFVRYIHFNKEEVEKEILYDSTPWRIAENLSRLIELNNYTNQYTEVFVNNKGVGRIPTPRPKNFDQVIPYKHQWITELIIENYIPPQLHFLGNEILELRNSTYETRISKTGICYTCPNIVYFGGDLDVTLVRPRLNIIDEVSIFSEYFLEAGYSDLKISDKGKFTKQTISKFGSLDDISKVFCDTKITELFLLFLKKENEKNPGSGEIVILNYRAYLDFLSIKNCLGSEIDAISFIDNSIQKEIFYRGYILFCSKCKQSDWYSIENLSQSFKCSRCGSNQPIIHESWKQGNEPTWYYKLDEVIYQGLSNNMSVPILTLSYLKQKSTGSFQFIPEIELRKESKSRKADYEIDICCIQDGKIILGECKVGGFTKKVIKKLITFGMELKRPPDLIVFSTNQEFISDEIRSFANNFSTIPCRFLLGNELQNR